MNALAEILDGIQEPSMHRARSWAELLREASTGLSKNQGRALRFTLQMGIRTPEDARRELPHRRDEILLRRAAGRGGSTEELRALNAILDDPERVFTRAYAAAADRLERDLADTDLPIQSGEDESAPRHDTQGDPL